MLLKAVIAILEGKWWPLKNLFGFVESLCMQVARILVANIVIPVFKFKKTGAFTREAPKIRVFGKGLL